MRKTPQSDRSIIPRSPVSSGLLPYRCGTPSLPSPTSSRSYKANRKKPPADAGTVIKEWLLSRFALGDLNSVDLRTNTTKQYTVKDLFKSSRADLAM
ncbi:hypothetical protein CMEL01_11698 [Colletotrichum melonis]|uniref:Uncharacterized protein n=1 Tax=Colletotrichum melonis TaxID=1209925 RepID=A0AAI9V111_9PEZI|nr:hypothetical protein CMEL01_11698 [Colletotrichum melonis]